MTVAARCTAQIALASHRPTTTSSSTATGNHSFAELTPTLRDAKTTGDAPAEDVLAARLCLAEILWLQQDYDGVLDALERVHEPVGAQDGCSALGWLEVCEIKTVIFRATALGAKQEIEKARQLYLASANRTPGSRTSELRRWTEQLLARSCMFMHKTKTTSIRDLSEQLTCFSAWSSFWQRAPLTTVGHHERMEISRRKVWKAYLDLMSHILGHNLVYNPASCCSSDKLQLASRSMSDSDWQASRQRQQATFRHVEATYESFLLEETEFPTASRMNLDVEEWAEQVTNNWKILHGPEWTDAELGQGKDRLGHDVLDKLYRAASKTFHSTAVLRHLFTVHAALGEFDLAMHAFGSYVDIISREKSRAKKTGQQETGFDSNDTAVVVAAEALRMLCKYGSRHHAEKANEVVQTLQQWLGLKRPGTSASSTGPYANGVHDAQEMTEAKLQSRTMSAAYGAIGVTQAHWSRVTYDMDARLGWQAQAIDNFKRSNSHVPDNLETAYPLAVLLAETREPMAAVQVVKKAIAAAEAMADGDESSYDYSRERQLIPLWHLLALLLSAQDEYESAYKICDAAFDQFDNEIILFGTGGVQLPSDTHPLPRSARGVVDSMDAFEKEGILQIKITQLALLEALEGAEVAVETSHELLKLYGRLFGSPGVAKPPAPKRPPTASSVTPSRTAGTLRSLAGSCCARTGKSLPPSSVRAPSVLDEAATTPERRNGLMSTFESPISITVTNEDGVSAEKNRHHHPHRSFRLRRHRGEGRSDSKSRVSAATDHVRGHSRQRDNDASAQSTYHEPGDRNETRRGRAPHVSRVFQRSDEGLHGDQFHRPSSVPEDPSTTHLTSETVPASTPRVQFQELQARQHKTSLLVQIWLFIAGLYLRAELHDESSSSAEEATKLVEDFELEVACTRAGASAQSFIEKGWGGGKSVDGLWADVLAAVSGASGSSSQWRALCREEANAVKQKGKLAVARALPFEAMAHYEEALARDPDHNSSTVNLSNLLLDIYEQKLPAEEPCPSLLEQHSSLGAPPTSPPVPPSPPPPPRRSADRDTEDRDPDPAQLNRLACRDRAYMLLSSLTKHGSAVDDAEAWMALARAHELSGELERAKDVLWWVVALDEASGIRAWSALPGRHVG